MSGPTVLCVMLANGRQEMVNRAVECYRRQNYEDKGLLILDTGTTLISVDGLRSQEDIYVDHSRPNNTETIGALRNRANLWAKSLDCDVIAHFDSDDYSSSQRLKEQVALLQASGADAVGYNEALFWDTTPYRANAWATSLSDGDGVPCSAPRNEAWLYTSPKLDVALGATLLYWRRTWEQKRFADLRFGEDCIWQTGMRVKAVSGLGTMDMQRADCGEPRFIAHIHGSNTSSVITPTVRDWKRMPGRDEECRRLMQL